MNKQLAIMALILGSGLSAAAHAQSSVQLYGTVDLGVEHFSNGAGSVNKLGNGILNPSVVGLKGQEDLGGGTSVFFQAETSFCANGAAPGASTANAQYCGPGFMGRTSIVGLKGSFGRFQMGRMFTLSNGDFYVIDPLHSDSLSPFGNTNVATIGEPVWYSQAIAYYSPSFKGFNAAAMYQFGDGIGIASTTGAYNLHLGYAQGPLFIGLDYENQKGPNNVTALKHTMLAAAYDFKMIRIGVYAARNRPDPSSGNPNLNAYALTASVPYGAATFIGEFAVQSDKTVSRPNTRMVNLGVLYALSKRTSLYAMYARATDYYDFVNEVDAFGNNDAPTAANGSGAASTGIALGVSMNF
ncbi:MAG: porin [Thiomonas sp.]|uniref:porin n=1 Tax=Thiomonas sp. TaxID=2047785 RepID=UPI002A36C3FA|nr:porin [Thiomonas sp.]MDY0330018.1 porin [Thiomonas sp.]